MKLVEYMQRQLSSALWWREVTVDVTVGITYKVYDYSIVFSPHHRGCWEVCASSTPFVEVLPYTVGAANDRWRPRFKKASPPVKDIYFQYPWHWPSTAKRRG